MSLIKLWEPAWYFIQNSNLKNFENWLKESKSLHFEDYNAIWRWSITNVDVFWTCILEYYDVQYSGSYSQPLSTEKMPGVKWFEGIELSYGQHLLRHKNDNREALVFINETSKKTISWATLQNEIRACQRYLKSIGVKKGDVVAAYLPNIPEAISCFIAVNSLGAVWTCCSPDFGESTVIERFSQCTPVALIAGNGYQYGGKIFDRQSSVSKIQSSVSSIKDTLLISYQNFDLNLENVTHWDEILKKSRLSRVPIRFTSVPFDHPIWILYSSGTTGKPKAITHSHGGVLLEHLKYTHLQNDIKAEEYFFWYSTTGWMMWNFLQSTLLVGAIPVLYDGSPAYPDLTILWKMIDKIGIHHFGTSAPFLTACMKEDIPINKLFSLHSLRSIESTGAPLPPEVFEWIYEKIKDDVWLCSMSGGTDVCTAFVGSSPYLPVYKGYIQSRALGCALFAYDENGERLNASLGEMVIEKPMPSMPIYFWNDEGNKRYKSSYFEEYPGKWRHGDWINIQSNGALTIHGRSDATLNRNGIRIGTAEIYSVMDDIKGVKDSLIINFEKNDVDVMPLFIVLEGSVKLDVNLKKIIKNTLRIQCSPRHIPTSIITLPDIPYTLSGKKMEVPVKKLIMKMTKPSELNRDSIKNPEAMDFIIENIDLILSKC
ncbi:MAG: acetoacetate--CoA ligase [Saprospiraceae bacterium]